MVLRIYIGIIICILSIQASKAQLTKRDSILLKNLLEDKGEIQLNKEAVKNIQFNFAPTIDENKKPMKSEYKPWMDFDKSLPRSINDTNQLKTYKYIRLLPYTIYTRWFEDPINDKLYIDKKDTMKIKIKFNLEYLQIKNQSTVSFDAEKLLYENLTKRGRAKRRNRKHANAWKIYETYVPTMKDSLKWYKNKDKFPENEITIKSDSLFQENKINR